MGILPLLHIYHTIMCKVEVRQKKRMGKRKELTAKRGSASGERRKFLHVSCYEYITVIILYMSLTHDFRPAQQAHCLVPRGLQLLTLCVESKRDRQS